MVADGLFQQCSQHASLIVVEQNEEVDRVQPKRRREYGVYRPCQGQYGSLAR